MQNNEIQEAEVCSKCSKVFPKKNLFPISLVGFNRVLCPRCLYDLSVFLGPVKTKPLTHGEIQKNIRAAAAATAWNVGEGWEIL